MITLSLHCCESQAIGLFLPLVQKINLSNILEIVDSNINLNTDCLTSLLHIKLHYSASHVNGT